MNPITRETFNRWTQKCNWIQTGEAATTDGRQQIFVTPSGNIAIAMFNLKGELMSIGHPMAMPQPPLPGVNQPNLGTLLKGR